MAKRSGISSRRSKPSYFMSIVGVALVLFLLGVLGVIVIHAEKLSRYFKENIEIQVILKNDTPKEAALALRDTLANQPYTKSVEYVSKEMAAQRFKKDFGEDFVNLLKFNPLYASENLKANAEYMNPDSLQKIENELLKNSHVREVYYQRTLVSKLNENIKKIGAIILAVSIILCLVVIVLIDNTIRLAMFSNRFLIKTMQMVGATRWFISRPFDLRSIGNGLISALLAIAGIMVVMYYAQKQLPAIRMIRDYKMTALLFIGMIIIGICISLLSTHRSVTRYLKMKLDDLY